jgi:hypothetical protein
MRHPHSGPCLIEGKWTSRSSQNFLFEEVGIATVYGLDGPGSVPGMATSQLPDRLWGPLILLSNGYRGRFYQG